MKCLIEKDRACEKMTEKCFHCGWEESEAERRKKLPLVEKDGVWRKEVAKE